MEGMLRKGQCWPLLGCQNHFHPFTDTPYSLTPYLTCSYTLQEPVRTMYSSYATTASTFLLLALLLYTAAGVGALTAISPFSTGFATFYGGQPDDMVRPNTVSHQSAVDHVWSQNRVHIGWPAGGRSKRFH